MDTFYHEIEDELYKKEGDRIHWRTNKLIDTDTEELVEIEFISMDFKGDFLIEVFKESEAPIADVHMLLIAAVNRVGKLFHNLIAEKGFFSTYPRRVKNTEEIEELDKEIERADFYIESRFVEKGIFTSAEKEIVETFSESSLETKLGFQLIKEGIPFLVQHEIRKNNALISKPDFFISAPSGPIAIFCDSYKYHDRKKDQNLR